MRSAEKRAAMCGRGAIVLVGLCAVGLVLNGCGTGGGTSGGGAGGAGGSGNGTGRSNSNSPAANRNSADEPDDGGSPANSNSAANANSVGGPAIPDALQGIWGVSGDCAAFSMRVAADGAVSLAASNDCSSVEGRVSPDGSFEVTASCETDIFGNPFDDPVVCTPTLSGQLVPGNVSTGTSVRNCTGDLIDSPCSFIVAQ